MYASAAQFNRFQKEDSCISGRIYMYRYGFFYFPTPVEIRIDGETFQTKPHACVFSEPGDDRWYYFPKDTYLHWVHALPETSVLLGKYRIPTREIFYPNDPSFIPGLIRNIKSEQTNRAENYEELMDLYFTELLIKLSRQINGNDDYSEISAADRETIQLVRDEFMASLEKKWNVTEMAARACMSVSHFHYLYRAIYKSSPQKDLILFRVEQGKDLLLSNPQANISQIAEMLGYQSQFHFINQFKSITGVTPGAFRKHYK